MRIRKISTVFIALILLVGYQNCSQVRFTDFGLLSEKGITLENGNGYGGKTRGQFYRFDPGFTCENKETYFSSIEVTDTSATYAENSLVQCGAIKQDLDPNLIDDSVYQKDIVGLKEGIFESVSATPQSIPANLVEVWCRNTKDLSGIESITHFNRVTSEAETEIYSTVTGAAAKQTFAVSRVLSAQTVTIRGADGLLIEVYRDKPAAEFGLFQGYFEGVVGGKKQSHPTSCRLGGSLDPRAWPAKQIADDGVKLFKVAKDLSYFGYTASIGTAPTRLYAADSSGANHTTVSPPMLNTGVENFDFVALTGDFLYWGDPRVKNGLELFRANRNGGNLIQLNAKLTEAAQGQASEIDFSADGRTVFYKDGQQETGGDVEMWLRSVPIDGGVPAVINPPLPLAGDVGVLSFGVSKSLNRVAYFVGFVDGELYIADLDGRNIVKPLGALRFEWYQQMEVPAPGKYLFMRSPYTLVNGTTTFTNYAVAFDGSGFVALPQNWSVNSVNQTGETALISKVPMVLDVSAVSAVPSALFDLRTGVKTDLPDLKNPSFSTDSKVVIGAKRVTGGLLQATSFGVQTKVEQALCSSVTGSEILVRENVDGSFFIAALQASDGIVTFYQAAGGGTCVKKNSVPVGGVKLTDLTLSPDRRSLMLKTTRTIASSSHDQLYFVPLSGRPPLAINAAVFTGARISSHLYLPDSRTILYLGDQASPGKYGVFSWRAP